MKLHELTNTRLTESEAANLENQIVNLLSVLSAEGITTVDTVQLVADLRDMGFTVDINTIVDLLDGIGIVSSASSEYIELDSSEAGRATSDEVKDRESNKVKQDAEDQATDEEELDVDPKAKKPSELDKAAQRQATKDM